MIFPALAQQEIERYEHAQHFTAHEGEPHAVQMPDRGHYDYAGQRQHQRTHEGNGGGYRAIVERREEAGGIHVEPHHEERYGADAERPRGHIQKRRIVAHKDGGKYPRTADGDCRQHNRRRSEQDQASF